MAVTADLPRLLYVGDVPVASSTGGSALLFRLLQDYPPDRLRIVESRAWHSDPSTRLPNVDYSSINSGWLRLLQTRLMRVYSAFCVATALRSARQLTSVVTQFKPQAILTVGHRFAWLAAGDAARRWNLPLHLIIHDDVVLSTGVAPWLRRWVDKKLGRVYRLAVSRSCVSPYMAEMYADKFGAAATVLYPSRARDAACFNEPTTMKPAGASTTYLFAGTINSPGYSRSLTMLASVLERTNGRLIVYSNLRLGDIKDTILAKPHVSVREMIRPEVLLERMRSEADVLFVPMSFHPNDLQNMRLGFPSKLADYTLTGLPSLIWGPADCSAVRWERENPGVAEVVEQEDEVALEAAVQRLTSSEHRNRLGSVALHKGSEFFSHDAALTTFYETLCRAGAQIADTGPDAG